jgi:chromosome partitioning protein
MAKGDKDSRKRGRRVFAALRGQLEEELEEGNAGAVATEESKAQAAPAPQSTVEDNPVESAVDVEAPSEVPVEAPSEVPVEEHAAPAVDPAPVDVETAAEPAAGEGPEAEGEDAPLAGEFTPPPLSVDGLGAGEQMTPLELPAIVAIANQKGGVGKTTTTVNLGAALAEEGYRVLVVDLDPQGNATTGIGVNPRDVERSVYDVIMHDTPVEDCVEPTALKNLFVVPATIDLAGAEIELVPAMSRELKLRRALHAVRDEYDIILIDCPPSLGLLTVNGLAGADEVIVPIQCEYYALEGLGQLLRNVSMVRSNLNQTLEVRGIVLTMYDGRTKLADQVVAEVRAHFGPKVYDTVIPRTVRLSEAPSFGQPIMTFDPTSRGAKAYRELAQEVSRGATKRAR